ncbi:hypothetical protein B0H10DRAFT_1979589 [Mycena sp. CBHHK59/15]|nr:hypothetical protein B0H10DRAFT_1979589 [Mycena sp. CBHHK59/15]
MAQQLHRMALNVRTPIAPRPMRNLLPRQASPRLRMPTSEAPDEPKNCNTYHDRGHAVCLWPSPRPILFSSPHHINQYSTDTDWVWTREMVSPGISGA